MQTSLKSVAFLRLTPNSLGRWVVVLQIYLQAVETSEASIATGKAKELQKCPAN